MCGIIGVCTEKGNTAGAVQQVKLGLKVMEYRGRDSQGMFELNEKVCIGHCLHAVVGHVPQPVENKKGVFAVNCEVYNWKELCKQHNIKADNDADLLLQLFQKKGIAMLNELDGVYSFVYLNKKENTLTIARDVLGVKPLWFTHTGGFAFASEKKALEKAGYVNVTELNPRKILNYDITEDKLSITERDFFSISPEHTAKKEEILKSVEEKLLSAVKKRIPDQTQNNIGLLFSGGVDSTLLAVILKKLRVKFTCYTAALEQDGLKQAEDLVYARKVAKTLDLDLKIKTVKLDDVPKYLKKVVPLIEDTNVVKVGVALTFYLACELAKKDNVKVMLSGLGSEELFAGYERHKKSQNVNKECVSGLLKMYERDLYRDDVITMANSMELRVPFLDKELTSYAIRIPGKYKLREGEKGQNKVVIREVAKQLGLQEEFAERKKKAAQYGSNTDKAIQKLTKKAGLKFKSEYVRDFYPQHNCKLAALVSGGKDSIFALEVMKRQNYAISCMITLKSKNPSSYMFHTPNIDLVGLQAKAMNLPLIEQETLGEKEKELEDLTKALLAAKEKYGIEGVITGALYSNYQRERIEKVCDKLGLKIFSPLWHINQETEMRQILNEGFEVWMSSVAAEGLDKTWLGRPLAHKDVDALVKLHDKIGLHVAGEGGEFESLILDGPGFEKRITIKKFKIVEETPHVSRMIVEKAVVEEK
jgi:diphthine-ammonia ligase